MGVTDLSEEKCHELIVFPVQEEPDTKKQCDAVLFIILMRYIMCSATCKHLIFEVSIVRSAAYYRLSQACLAIRVGI